MDANLEEMRGRLNAVSPSFCLAKWYQVTIHLQNGHTHSCHHPATHRIPLAEIAANPSALHNTQFKKEQRQKMLTGVRPAECDYCWKVEDASPSNFSDRTYKSNEDWAAPDFEAARTMPWDADVIPNYLEVSFSNVCNFKCSYCSPKDSSKWVDEIKQFGPYPTSSRLNDLTELKKSDSMPIPEREDNPYVEAFWKWWPELFPKLKVFRITGGEPLLSKHTMRVLEWFIENPQPYLSLAINSNLVIPPEIYNRFLGLVSKIVERGCVGNFELYTSADAHGRHADYIRNGMDYDTWLANARRYLETIPDRRLSIMSTFNALSVTSFSGLYADLIELRKTYPDHRPGAGPEGRIDIDIPYLRHPEFESVLVLPAEYGERVDALIEEIKQIPEATKKEVAKLTRIRSLMRANPWPEKKLRLMRADFYKFFAEHDRRRGTDFLATFPEMADFWRMCGEQAEPGFWESSVGSLRKVFAGS